MVVKRREEEKLDGGERQESRGEERLDSDRKGRREYEGRLDGSKREKSGSSVVKKGEEVLDIQGEVPVSGCELGMEL